MNPSSTAPKAREKRRRQEIKYLTEQEIDQLFKVIESARDYAMLLLGYQRGLRAREIGGLRLSDYLSRDDRIIIRRLKGSKGGEYHLTSREVRALKRWLKVRGYEPGPLFPSRRGRGVSQQMLDVLMKRYCSLAGIPREKAHVHSLKHSCGTHLLNRGESIEDVQDHLGHRQISNTLKYADYTNLRRIQRDKRLRDW